jgi:16S rRNA (guanine527-N7)-methyltransferase
VAEDLDWFSTRLHHHLDAYVSVTHAQVQSLFSHYELLVRWNRKMNLTSIRSPEEIVVRHYCESLFFAAHVPKGWRDFADIGSGAGFPGVPMAVTRPDWKVTLVDSHQRKAVFLRECTRSLTNVSVLAERLEDLDRSFGAIVSRAVDPATILSLPQLGKRFGLLVGAASYEMLRGETGLIWDSVVRVPWGDHRLCVFGVSASPCST